MDIGYQFWIERNGEIVLDKRLEELLKATDELQSLSAATRRFKMSYRQAWGKLRRAEDHLGFKLLDCPVRGKGVTLTPGAVFLLNQYATMQRSMANFFREESRRLSFRKDGPERHKESPQGRLEEKMERRVTVVRSSRNTTFRSRELRSYAMPRKENDLNLYDAGQSEDKAEPALSGR